MKLRPLILLIAALLATAAIAGAALAPRLGRAGVPTDFEIDTRAFGYVESVEEVRDGCRTQIGFEAGRVAKRWYLSDRTFAAYSCGGLEMNWIPAPQG